MGSVADEGLVCNHHAAAAEAFQAGCIEGFLAGLAVLQGTFVNLVGTANETTTSKATNRDDQTNHL